ncbi:hypothetical protein GE21DRAFT_3457 [Neurospora crassa]|uniref:Uncharacterized protein n=2 Tax=Neurospora crassa TaxID=5141 RepID=Q1K5J4_NEUCR|nr:hypothetical protein NCU01529 [Neurospora crassa OR74A]EAA27742.1 hypothetical protein NCU01529 [Neurospora crassa OR74A]KHE87213.1 hypothetical protein GE21DRAFT_3457 [Neurospora crassa]CAD21243.1 hypothetical protein [Neurospora crassa]|eukprot:XP_956978.1 hypothetical protein NCU01529 [Neurospora crassa OR74A]
MNVEGLDGDQEDPSFGQLQLLDSSKSGEYKCQCREQAALPIDRYRACGYSGERDRQHESGTEPSWQHSSGPFRWMGPDDNGVAEGPGFRQGYRCILGGFGSVLARGMNRRSHELSRIAAHLPREPM